MNTFRPFRVLLVIWLCVLCTLPAAAYELPQLLEKVREHYDLMQRSLIKGRTEQSYTPPGGVSESHVFEHTICTDGNRVMLDVRGIFGPEVGQKYMDLDREYDLWDGENRYSYCERGTAGPRMSMLTVYPNYDSRETPIPISTLKDGFWRGAAFIEIDGFATVLLKNCEAVIYDKNVEESVSGVPCYRLELDICSGKRIYWVAKEFGNNIVRYKIEYPEGVGFNGSSAGGKDLHSMVYEVKSLFQQNGEWLPREVVARFKIVRADGTTIVEDTTKTICLEAMIAPDFDQLGSFNPNIPDGVVSQIMGTPYTAAMPTVWDAEKKEIRTIDRSHSKSP